MEPSAADIRVKPERTPSDSKVKIRAAQLHKLFKLKIATGKDIITLVNEAVDEYYDRMEQELRQNNK